MAVPYHTHTFEIPTASKADVEAGTRDDVAATPAALGSAATKDVSYFATASQGGNADTAVQSVNGKTGTAITLDKSDIGLGSVDNTSDINKPVSTAMQAALDAKADATSLGTAAYSNTDAFATAAQGVKADSAVQPARLISTGTGLTGGGNLSADRTLALNAASIASLAKADSAVQPSRAVNAGAGLSGGGDLSTDRTLALNSASLSSLAKADTALQAPGGSTGQVLTKNSETDNDVSWQTVAAATAVSYAPQSLNSAQQAQARANIGAFSTSGGTVDGNVRINGFSEFRRGTNAAQAIPLGLGWENAVNTHWRFVLEMNGSLSLSYYNPATGAWVNTPWTVSTAGAQTFFQVPICASTPTDASHLTRKAYVDGIVSPKADTTYVNSQLAGKASTGANVFSGNQEIRGGVPSLYFISSNIANGYRIFANISDTVNDGIHFAAGYSGIRIASFYSSGAVTVSGAFSAASKSFKTDHPIDPLNKDVIYASTESPSHGIEYWGTMRLVGGRATVDVDAHYGMMPGTFQAMTKDTVVFLQNQESGKPVYRQWNPDGTLEIICDDETCNDLIGWQVKGIRKDAVVFTLPYTDPVTGRLIPEQEKPEA
ncbi:hypothetical protein R5W60_05625 [Brucella pseudintermedia]|uniref:hypothetical protein n=1 Tax=Brucella pseudintermedia TaxID=370111 RepID=UPI0036735A25|nr:hypothetical protein R5W60_05625 [Brucella pseudintermedia]